MFASQDINKWLDDTPRFSEFSSASNSPSHLIGAEEYDVVRSRIESEYRHSLKLDRDRPSSGTSSRSNKDGKVGYFEARDQLTQTLKICI
jgi:hypothetical protein